MIPFFSLFSAVLGPLTYVIFVGSMGVLGYMFAQRWEKWRSFRKFVSLEAYTRKENFDLVIWAVIAIAAFAIDLMRRAYMQTLQASKILTDGMKLVRLVLTILTIPSMGWSKGSAFTRSVCDSVKAVVDGSDVIAQELQADGDEKVPKIEEQIAAAATGPTGFVSGGALADQITGNNKLQWSNKLKANVCNINGANIYQMKKLALTDEVMDEDEVVLAIASYHEFFLQQNNMLSADATICAFPKHPDVGGIPVKLTYRLGSMKKWFELLGVWHASDPRPMNRPVLAELDVWSIVSDFDKPTKKWYDRLRQQYTDLCTMLDAKDKTKQLVVVLGLVLFTLITYCGYIYTFKRKAKAVVEANKEMVAAAVKLEEVEKQKIQEQKEQPKVIEAQKTIPALESVQLPHNEVVTGKQGNYVVLTQTIVDSITTMNEKLAFLESEHKLSKEQRDKARNLDPNNAKNERVVEQNFDNFVAGAADTSNRKPPKDSSNKFTPIQEDSDDDGYVAIQQLVNKEKNQQVKKKLTEKQQRRKEKQEHDRFLQFFHDYKEQSGGKADNELIGKLSQKYGFTGSQLKELTNKYKAELETKPKVNFHKVFAARVGNQNFVCRSCFEGKTEHPVGQDRPEWYKGPKWVKRPCLNHAAIVMLLKRNAEEFKHCDEYHTILAVHENWKGTEKRVDSVLPSQQLEALNPNVHNLHMTSAAKSAFHIQLDAVDDEKKEYHAASNGVCAKGLYIVPLHIYQVVTSKPLKTIRLTISHLDSANKIEQKTIVDATKLQEFDRMYQAHVTNDQLALADLFVINNSWWAKCALPTLHSTGTITNQPVVKQSTISPVFVEKKIFKPDGTPVDVNPVEWEVKSICTTRIKEDVIDMKGNTFQSLCYIASTKDGDCGFGVYLHNCLAATHRRGNESPGEQSGRLFTPRLVELLTHANDPSWLFQVGGSSRKD